MTPTAGSSMMTTLIRVTTTNTTIMFMVLSSRQNHYKFTCLFDECKLSAGWPPTLRPRQPTWAVTLSWTESVCRPLASTYIIAIYYCYSTRKLILILPFTIPRRVQGLIVLGTAVRVRSPCRRLYIAVAVAINTSACGGIRSWDT